MGILVFGIMLNGGRMNNYWARARPQVAEERVSTIDLSAAWLRLARRVLSVIISIHARATRLRALRDFRSDRPEPRDKRRYRHSQARRLQSLRMGHGCCLMTDSDRSSIVYTLSRPRRWTATGTRRLCRPALRRRLKRRRAIGGERPSCNSHM